jgi:hypothetical protein
LARANAILFTCLSSTLHASIEIRNLNLLEYTNHIIKPCGLAQGTCGTVTQIDPVFSFAFTTQNLKSVGIGEKQGRRVLKYTLWIQLGDLKLNQRLLIFAKIEPCTRKRN